MAIRSSLKLNETARDFSKAGVRKQMLWFMSMRIFGINSARPQLESCSCVVFVCLLVSSPAILKLVQHKLHIV